MVAELERGKEASSIDFTTPSRLPYSESIKRGVPYVTAEYKYDDFPGIVVIGDNRIIGHYYNAPLKSGTRYAFALRSVSEANQSLYSTSEPTVGETASVSSTTTKDTDSVLIAVSVVAFLLGILVIILIVQRRRRRSKDYSPAGLKSKVNAKRDRLSVRIYQYNFVDLYFLFHA
jgi:hypothetical protein